MKYKKIIIFGGTSEISLELLKLYSNETEKFIIFCRNEKKFLKLIDEKNYSSYIKDKTEIFETDLYDLDENLKIIQNFENDISGIFWIAGYTGDGIEEYIKIDQAEKNIKINFLNPTVILTEISKKIVKKNNSFIAVFTSVAGLRGRKKLIYYSSSKSGLIAFLSALRQKLFKNNILVTTIIPGYMNTKSFRDLKQKTPNILVTNPVIVASILKRSIDKRKEIVYINNLWRIIMSIIKIIPERIFKRFSFQKFIFYNRKNLIKCLYNIKSLDLNRFTDPSFGKARGSDYELFQDNQSITEDLKQDLVSITQKIFNSDVFFRDSFFTILEGDSIIKKHNHIGGLDLFPNLNLWKQKYSLVYYLSIGDQDCKYPGSLKFYEDKNSIKSNSEILPTEGMIIIFPADRYHSVKYDGNKDRVIIGVNFYCIQKDNHF